MKAADFYVAPNGNDQWAGALPAPSKDGTDGPFATLERARDAVRGLKPGKPVTVMLRGGTHFRHQPFVLSPRDSGSEDAPVTYAAYPGETPVISSGRRLTGWTKAEGGLWTMPLPEVAEGKWHFRSLFINGRRRGRARLPREGEFHIAGAADRQTSNWAALCPEAKDDTERRSFQFAPGDLRGDWRNLEDVEVVVLQFWTAARLRVASLDEERHTALFTGGSWRPLTWSFGYYVDNVFEGLDAPGAWYLDRKGGTLHYHPLPGEEPGTAETVAPVAERLVTLAGDVGGRRFVQHVHFKGLSFRHTDWTLPAEGYSQSQAELPPAAAFEAVGARRCRIEACAFSGLGGWGVALGQGCQDNAVVRSTVEDVGAGCLKIGETANGGDDEEEACRTLVSDNVFRDGSRVYLGAPAVWIGQSGHNTVSHNEIAGAFHWAVSVGWIWGYFPLGRARDNIVEFNHVHHLGTGVLGTHGALYCLGTQPGTVLRNNYIHHVFCNNHWGAGEGIILDNGCNGILVENNVVHDAVAGGWGCNFNCFGNLILNNVFAYGTKFQLTRYGDAPDGEVPPNGEVFARNLVVWKDGPLFAEKDWWAFQTLWNYNLYWRYGGEPVKFMSYSFEEWKAKGIVDRRSMRLDGDSIVADPLFVDPEHGDYSLRPGSPALKLGFRPIDLSAVGPRTNP